MYTIKSLLKKAVNILREVSTGTEFLDAEVLLMHFLHVDRIKLIVDSEKPVEDSIADQFLHAIEDRKAGKPVQYIVNKQEFMGLEFFVREGVLIPRSDTETVVEKAIELIKSKEMPIIIDMCTGSGAIALTLAYNIKDSKVYAVDLSDDAIFCCNENINRYHLNDRVILYKGNLFEAIENLDLKGKVDMIISNPPYIPTSDIEELGINVKDFEPHLALDGGVDGLDFYRIITEKASEYLKNGGILVYEIGYNQGQEVIKLVQESDFYEDLEITRDLASLDRCVSASYMGAPNTRSMKIII